jgi:hypothetical protein
MSSEGPKLKNKSFSIQADNSTDFTNESYVVVFLQFVNDNEIHENFFCGKMLSKTSRKQDIFNVFISENEMSVLGKWCRYLYYIAASIVGSIRGFTSLQNNRKKDNSDIITHCFLQSQ